MFRATVDGSPAQSIVCFDRLTRLAISIDGDTARALSEMRLFSSGLIISLGRRPPNLLGGGSPPPLRTTHGSRLLVSNIPSHSLFGDMPHRADIVARTPEMPMPEDKLEVWVVVKHDNSGRPLQDLDDAGGGLGGRRFDEQVDVVRHHLQLLDLPASGLGDRPNTCFEPPLNSLGKVLAVLGTPDDMVGQFVDGRTCALDFHRKDNTPVDIQWCRCEPCWCGWRLGPSMPRPCSVPSKP